MSSAGPPLLLGIQHCFPHMSIFSDIPVTTPGLSPFRTSCHTHNLPHALEIPRPAVRHLLASHCCYASFLPLFTKKSSNSGKLSSLFSTILQVHSYYQSKPCMQARRRDWVWVHFHLPWWCHYQDTIQGITSLVRKRFLHMCSRLVSSPPPRHDQSSPRTCVRNCLLWSLNR